MESPLPKLQRCQDTVRGVHLPRAAGLWLPPLPPVMVLPQPWGPTPVPIPTTVAPKGSGLKAFVTCHTVSPSMGGISPACHNKVYYENRLVWGQRDRQVHLGWVAQVK